MKFEPKKVAFGRHETFPLRMSWLPKGVQQLENDKHLFEDVGEATVKLGVGKNMVLSIRYWMRAVGAMDPKDHTLTQFGRAIFSGGHPQGLDPYLEDEGTLWLLHWQLASNAELATAWYWFFNCFHKPRFTGIEAQSALRDFVNANVIGKSATKTLTNDVTLLLRMYAQSRGNGRMQLEDALDNPLSILGLVDQEPGGRAYLAKPAHRPSLPEAVLAYAVIELFKERGVQALPLEEMMYSREGYPAPGAVFGLSEASLVSKLEVLAHAMPENFEIRETAGIHQLYYLKEVDSIELLKAYYTGKGLEAAA